MCVFDCDYGQLCMAAFSCCFQTGHDAVPGSPAQAILRGHDLLAVPPQNHQMYWRESHQCQYMCVSLGGGGNHCVCVCVTLCVCHSVCVYHRGGRGGGFSSKY